MIESIWLRDFQAHKHLTVKLSPTVTSIVGPSDIGKSAIIRALRWLVFNRPLGQAFIRDGASSTEVTVRCEKHSLTRGKGKDGNYYTVDGKALGALGSDVPTSVQSVLMLAEENFQSQHDAPFWFSETSGEVSRRLNEIVNLGVMDDVQAELLAGLRRYRAELEVITARLAEATNKRESLSYVPDLLVAVDGCTTRKEKLDKLAEDRERLITRMTEVATEQDRHAQLEAILVQASPVVADAADARVLRKKVTELGALLGELKSNLQQASRQVPNLDRLAKLYGQVNDSRSEVDGLTVALRNLTDAQERRSALDEALKRDDKRLQDMIGKECPLCGQPVQ